MTKKQGTELCLCVYIHIYKLKIYIYIYKVFRKTQENQLWLFALPVSAGSTPRLCPSHPISSELLPHHPLRRGEITRVPSSMNAWLETQAAPWRYPSAQKRFLRSCYTLLRHISSYNPASPPGIRIEAHHYVECRMCGKLPFTSMGVTLGRGAFR